VIAPTRKVGSLNIRGRVSENQEWQGGGTFGFHCHGDFLQWPPVDSYRITTSYLHCTRSTGEDIFIDSESIRLHYRGDDIFSHWVPEMVNTKDYRTPLPRARRDFQSRPEADKLRQWWLSGASGIFALIGGIGEGKSMLLHDFLQWTRSTADQLHRSRPHFVYSFDERFTSADTCGWDLYCWLHILKGGTHIDNSGAVPPTPAEIASALRLVPEPILIALDAVQLILPSDGIDWEQRDPMTWSEILDWLLWQAARGGFPRVAWVLTSHVPPPSAEKASREEHDAEYDYTPGRYSSHTSEFDYYHPVPVGALPVTSCIHILRGCGIRGSNQQVQLLAEHFGCHAYLISLVGGYLRAIGQTDPEYMPTILPVTSPIDQSQRAGVTFAARLREVHNVFELFRTRLYQRDPAGLALLQRLCLFRAPVRLDLIRMLFVGDDKDAISGTHLKRLKGDLLIKKLEDLAYFGLIDVFEESGHPSRYGVTPLIKQLLPTTLTQQQRYLIHRAIANELERALTKVSSSSFGQPPLWVPPSARSYTSEQPSYYANPGATGLLLATRLADRNAQLELLSHLIGSALSSDPPSALSQESIAELFYEWHTNKLNDTVETAIRMMFNGHPIAMQPKLPMTSDTIRRHMCDWLSARFWLGRRDAVSEAKIILHQLFPKEEEPTDALEYCHALNIFVAVFQHSGRFALGRNVVAQFSHPWCETMRELMIKSGAGQLNEEGEWVLTRMATVGALVKGSELIMHYSQGIGQLLDSPRDNVVRRRWGMEELNIEAYAEMFPPLSDYFFDSVPAEFAFHNGYSLDEAESAIDRSPHLNPSLRCDVLVRCGKAFLNEVRNRVMQRHSDGAPTTRAAEYPIPHWIGRTEWVIDRGLTIARQFGLSPLHAELLLLRAQLALVQGRPADARRDSLTALFGLKPVDRGVDPFLGDPRLESDDPDNLDRRAIVPTEEDGRPAILAITHPELEHTWLTNDHSRVLADADMMEAAFILGSETFDAQAVFRTQSPPDDSPSQLIRAAASLLESVRIRFEIAFGTLPPTCDKLKCFPELIEVRELLSDLYSGRLPVPPTPNPRDTPLVTNPFFVRCWIAAETVCRKPSMVRAYRSWLQVVDLSHDRRRWLQVVNDEPPQEPFPLLSLEIQRGSLKDIFLCIKKHLNPADAAISVPEERNGVYGRADALQEFEHIKYASWVKYRYGVANAVLKFIKNSSE
jgi:hypothetical protein